MISAEQIRAARALLNWKQSDLARESNISLASINNIERRIGSPRTDTLRTIADAFETAGIEFIAQEGVRKRADYFAISEYQGKEFIKEWMEDFIPCMTGPEDILRVCGLDERKFPEYAPDQLLRYAAHQEKTGFREKILIAEDDTFLTADPECYRWITHAMLGTVPYLVYKDRFVLAMYDVQRIVVVRNKAIADTFINQFEFLWQGGRVLPPGVKNKLVDQRYLESLKRKS